MNNPQKEIKKTLSFTMTVKKICVNKLNQGGLYNENYKMLLKEIKEDINNLKDILCSWFGRLHVVEISMPLTVLYEFHAIHKKILTTFFLQK